MIDKQDIKNRLSLPAVVEFCTGEHIPHSRMIKCPFHNDHNPSCRIYSDHWHCFGCNRHGDVIEWVTQWEQTGFKQALQICNDLLDR